MASIKPIPTCPNIVVKDTAKLTWTIAELANVMEQLWSPKFYSPNSLDEFELKLFFERRELNESFAYFGLSYNGPKRKPFFVIVLQLAMIRNAMRRHLWNCVGPFCMFQSKPFMQRDELSRYLIYGRLTIYCKVDILGENPLIESFDNLSQNYGTLLESGKFSDFIVAIGEKQFRVHKNILAARSAVFAAMFEHEETKEVKEGRLVLEDVQVEVFELMIRHIYTGKFDKSLDEYAADLLVAADKYQFDHLKSICEQSLITTLTGESVCAVFLLADMHNSDNLKSKCIQYIVKHAKEVIPTEAWKELKANRADLLVELFEMLAIKDD